MVDQDTSRMMGDGAHWATRRHLSGTQGRIASSGLRGEHLDLHRRFVDPALHERPGRILAVDQFSKVTHQLQTFRSCHARWQGTCISTLFPLATDLSFLPRKAAGDGCHYV